MDSVIIRNFTSSDINQITELLKKIGWVDQYISGQKKSINKLIADEEGEVFVATILDAIVGYIQVQHHKWNRLSHLHGLVVSKDYRRLGIARKLVGYVEQSSAYHGNRGLYLDTPVDNLGGRAFYKAIGYSEAYIMPEFYEPGLDGITYLKLFTSPKNLM